MKQSINILISGGGTGGHIYPAIAIANELKVRYPEAKFLFVNLHSNIEEHKKEFLKNNINHSFNTSSIIITLKKLSGG